MGLDMFVYAKKVHLADKMVDFEVDYNWDRDEICYWRKHPNLHGWMRELYYEKGGHSDEGFNGDRVRLVQEDIDSLEKAIHDNKLPNTSGFFFGQSPEEGDDHYEKAKMYDLECVQKMRNALNEGMIVWYDSSW
jgi:hypothetical protein